MSEKDIKLKNKTISLLFEIDSSEYGVYRKFLSKEEIKLCNKLTKDGLVYKGKPDERGATIAFFITEKGYLFLQENINEI